MKCDLLNGLALSGKFFGAFVIVSFMMTQPSYAQSIPITISDSMEKVIFDGKWTFLREWKESSSATIGNNDIYIRTAHHGNYIYVFIDALNDTGFYKGSDYAVVCFDGNHDKSAIADSDDYCFVVTLARKIPFILQGGSPLAVDGNFKKIPNTDGFIGIGGISDENDRYTPIPHASYEFKIPTDLIGRSDVYGFYVGVYCAHSNKIYSWPETMPSNSLLKIPSPSLWGEIVSPDKSLPEFQWPIVLLLIAIISVLYITRRKQISFN